MSKGFKDYIAKCAESILRLQDKIGATIHQVYLVKRAWSGAQIGDGASFDTNYLIEPSPHVQEFSQNIMAGQGAIEQGDVLLKYISKTEYTREFLGPQTESPLIEKFYLIDGKEYRVVNIKETLVYFNVLVRATITQRKR